MISDDDWYLNLDMGHASTSLLCLGQIPFTAISFVISILEKP